MGLVIGCIRHWVVPLGPIAKPELVFWLFSVAYITLELCRIHSGIPPSPSLALEAVPSHYFPSPFLFPFPTLFSRVCVGCRWGVWCLCAGARAYMHLGVVQWCPRDLFPHCRPSLWFLLPLLPLATATLFSWPPSNYLAHPLASLLIPFPFSSSRHQGTLSSLHSFCFSCMFMIVYELNPKLGI